MYVGLAFAFVGTAILANWPWALAVLPVVLAVVYVAAIKPEEHFLSEKFGQDYAAYRSRVRRWL
jgi:protein-S-isoprenylcysteine O-methyltransferase Ste14